MNKSILPIVAAVFGLLGIFVVSYISAFNYGNKAEGIIRMEHKNMQNILSQYSLKVAEVAQVPGIKTEDLQKITKEAMTGRYGADGSKAVFQFITENYPGQVTDTLYENIQTVMEIGRNEIKNISSKFTETKEMYVISLGSFWRGKWLNVAGYPKINLSEYNIVLSSKAITAFETGIDIPIKIR